MKPLIFHCDCNNFFASCECLTDPKLKNVPMAVAGDPDRRTGIVVAKNELAKKAGVKTTDTVWQAKKKCPDIVFVPPRHGFYRQISDKVNQIYLEYTDYVEPASIDESYLDMTGAPEYFGMSETETADLIRKRVREEIGITISIGVSYNKVFAKMGSDYKKPDATTLISPENYKSVLWPLPVEDMLFAGRATCALLRQNGVNTVGGIAQSDRARLENLFGAMGAALYDNANGLNRDKVRLWGDRDEAKSISHGMTFKRNLVTKEEVKTGVGYLSDKVAQGLRNAGQKAKVISVSVKTPELKVRSKQTALKTPTRLRHEIADISMRLIEENIAIGVSSPIRAITVGASGLIKAEEDMEQLSLFDDADAEKRKKLDRLEGAIDEIRKKTGKGAVTLGFPKNEDIGID